MIKTVCIGCLIWSSAFLFSACAQGTFQNFNFESANIPPSTPIPSFLPISDALPGWTATPSSPVVYDGISTGGEGISIIDQNESGFQPLQGNYSVLLFGGGAPSVISAEISQTGVVPNGTQSLLFEGYVSSTPFVVTLGGQTLNMIPLQTFPNTGSYPPYNLYGGNFPSAFDGQSETLTFTEPAPATSPPSMFELDDISFSTQAVPEPSPFVLSGIGGLLFALYRRFAPKQK